MKDQAASDLPLLRDELARGQKCVQRPWVEGVACARPGQIGSARPEVLRLQ